MLRDRDSSGVGVRVLNRVGRTPRGMGGMGLSKDQEGAGVGEHPGSRTFQTGAENKVGVHLLWRW